MTVFDFEFAVFDFKFAEKIKKAVLNNSLKTKPILAVLFPSKVNHHLLGLNGFKEPSSHLRIDFYFDCLSDFLSLEKEGGEK